jgi:hypothetical protein
MSGWRFRKSFSPIPGVRLTLSPSGISTSVGFGPIRLTAGTRGPAVTARIPGTGIAFRQELGAGSPRPLPQDMPVLFTTPAAPPPVPGATPIQTTAPGLEEIKSAGSGVLTTSGLAAFRSALQQARQQHDSVSLDLASARHKESIAAGKYRDWEDGWLLRRLFTQRFERMKLAADEATALRTELEEQEQLSRLQTEINMPDGVAKAFHRLCDEFVNLGQAKRIWDTVGQRDTNRIAERTAAHRTVDRRQVAFRLGNCSIIETSVAVPHLQNANGGDLYLFPGFVVYFASPTNFALLEYPEVSFEIERTRFHEQEEIPSDSQVIGHTWAKVNKDGTPDRRFKDNFQIPVVQYATLTLRSSTGLNEEWLLSAVERTQAFGEAWSQLRLAVKLGA